MILMEGGFAPRIGTFLILIGLGLLVIFIGSAFTSNLNIGYFVLSAIAFGLGAYLRRGSSRRESGRFNSIRKIREQSRIKKEERGSKDLKR